MTPDQEQAANQKMWDEATAARAADANPESNDEPIVKASEPEPGHEPVNEDPFANLHPEVKRRLEALDQLESRLRNTEGHIGGLNKATKRIEGELQNELAAAKAAAKAVDDAPSQKQIQSAAADSEKWKQLKTDFPEWTDAIDERLGGIQPAPAFDVEGLRTKLTDDLSSKIRGEVTAEMEQKLEMRLIDIAHRGWIDTVNSPEYLEWYKTQPQNIQALAESSKAEDAIDLLNKYADTRKKTVSVDKIKEDRKQRLESATTPVRGVAQSPKKSIEDMTDEEVWQAAAMQRKRQN